MDDTDTFDDEEEDEEPQKGCCVCSKQQPKNKRKIKPRVAKGALYGVGTPLMDLIATVDEKFLKKYGLKPNSTMLGTDSLLPMLFEMFKDKKVKYFPGGAEQNTFRVFQWILQKPHISVFFGATGNGKNADKLEKIMKEDGVDVHFLKFPEYHTGTCVVLITGEQRTLVAYLSASNYFNKEYMEMPMNFKYIEEAKLFYVTGFFLTVSLDCILALAKHSDKKKKAFSMNLAAPYICKSYVEPMLQVIPYVDILFGNTKEAEALAEATDVKSKDIHDIAKAIARLPKMDMDAPRMVILTQGPDNVLVATQFFDGIYEFPVPPVAPKKIKDTCGAGDAFVGGFLAQTVQGAPLAQCITCGIWAASQVIQQEGCSFPKNKFYDPNEEPR